MEASVYVATSLDGFIARENGDLDWLSGADIEGSGEDYGFHEFMDSVDILVMGRKTFEMVVSSGEWPYGNRQVVVLSSRPVQIPSDLAGTVELQSCSPTELVRQLSERGAKHLYIDGGKTIQGFLNAGLIHQIIITKIPVLIGEGISLFGPVCKDIKLRHIETISFAHQTTIFASSSHVLSISITNAGYSRGNHFNGISIYHFSKAAFTYFDNAAYLDMSCGAGQFIAIYADGSLFN